MPSSHFSLLSLFFNKLYTPVENIFLIYVHIIVILKTFRFNIKNPKIYTIELKLLSKSYLFFLLRFGSVWSQGEKYEEML